MQSADIAEQFEKHINSPKQSWLLGAGVSFDANIPLMYPLTKRALEVVRTGEFADDEVSKRVLAFIEDDCGDNSHIEHMLTHLGDLISIAQRSRAGEVEISGEKVNSAVLVRVHNELLKAISGIVRWGYVPAREDEKGEVVAPPEVGTPEDSIVTVESHLRFIRAIFGTSRAGLDHIRSPVEFFTTNYDTLLEDALALSAVSFKDGFTGGGVGFWDAANYTASIETKAVVTKLHGSIDWYKSTASDKPMLRVRYGDKYPESGGEVMIYPQATKYLNTQRDPFSALFQRFRVRLADGADHVLLVCGYSFGDEHINAEIEAAMACDSSQLTLVAFAAETADGLPGTLERWRQDRRFSTRVYVASQRGLYRGNDGPAFPAEGDQTYDWWTFKGASELFDSGLPSEIEEAIE